MNLLQDLRRRLGLATILITHDLAVVRHVSHVIAVMYVGRIVELADAVELFREPRHPYTVAVLSAHADPRPVDEATRVVLRDVPVPGRAPVGMPLPHPLLAARAAGAPDRCASEVPALRTLAPRPHSRLPLRRGDGEGRRRARLTESSGAGYIAATAKTALNEARAPTLSENPRRMSRTPGSEARAFDVIVCGAGTAGCVVAGRLAQAGARVLALEAGSDFGPAGSGRWPEELVDAARLPLGHDWGYAGTGAGGQPLAFDRARVIGGSSSHNGCAQSVGWRGDYDRWAASGCDGWSGADLEPLFDEGVRRMRVGSFAQEDIQPFQAAFLDAAVEAGVPRTDDLDDLDGGIGCAVEPMNIVDGVRWNAAFAYLDPVRDRTEILGGALVDRVLLERGRAVGVRAIVDGGPSEFSTDLIVLAAGAYGTPEILLRSGIGPRGDLEALDVEPAVDLRGVGGNLHDQPAIELRFAGTHELRRDLEDFAAKRWLPEEQTLAKLASPFAEGPYDLHVYPWVEPDPALPSGWRCVFPVGLLTPRSRGRVLLVDRAPTRRGLIDHRYLAEPDDIPPLVAGVRWAGVIARSQPLARYVGEPLDPPPQGDADLQEWIRSRHTHYWHPAGSCRMGRADDRSSVVDHDGRVHGVESLRVADASVFPEIPRSTPALPTVVVGERIVRSLVRNRDQDGA